MNTKITYRWNNGEIDDIVTDGIYDFYDWLIDNGVDFEEENGSFYVVEDGKRTGEEYVILSEEKTTENLRG